MSIVNYGPGPNTGYKINVSWVVSNLSFPDAPKKDEPEPSFSPIPAKTTTKPPISGSTLTEPSDEQETITVKVPGPDGELIDVEIPLVKAAGVSKKDAQGSSPLVPIVLGLFGLGGILFLYFFVWRRRRGGEESA